MGNGARDGQRRAGWATARGMGNGARHGQRRAGLPTRTSKAERLGSRMPPGAPCNASRLGLSKSLFIPKAYALLWTHPRLQRCGSAALHHTSLRSLTATASLIVGVSRSVFLRSRTSVDGGEHTKMRGLHKAENA